MARDRLQRGDEIGGRYQVLDTVGEGGMAVVYRVRHQLTGQLGALKILRASALGEESVRTKFVQEARIGSRIPSDHVVEVTDAGIEADGTPWLVMELLEGDTLAEHLHRAGPLPITEVGDVLRQICHGLGAAHRAGVVHRDLKPANVFLARTRRADVQRTVKILDFGIARLLQDAHAPGTNTLLAGTPGWMAPEQGVSGMKVSARADVWALGLLAFEMIVGRGYFPPNQGLGFDVLPSATVRAEALGRRSLVPDWFDRWFGQCVAMDPSARFADAGAAFEAVASALLGFAPTAAATPKTHAVTPPTVRATPRTVPSIPPTLPSTPPPAAVSVPPAPRREVRWKPFALGLGGLVAALLAVSLTVRLRAEPTAFVAPPTPVVTPPTHSVARWIPIRPDALTPMPLDQNPLLATWLDRWAERVRNAHTLTAEDWSALYADPVDHGGRMSRERLVHHWTIRATQGLFTYDPTRSTWFVEPTSAGSPASCRIPADSDDVVVLRLVASDTGFEDAVDVGCVPMTGTYSIRARIVGGSPLICSEAWYDCQSFCAGCSAPGVRRWACCRR